MENQSVCQSILARLVKTSESFGLEVVMAEGRKWSILDELSARPVKFMQVVAFMLYLQKLREEFYGRNLNYWK